MYDAGKGSSDPGFTADAAAAKGVLVQQHVSGVSGSSQGRPYHSKGVETRPDRGRDHDAISADGRLIQI